MSKRDIDRALGKLWDSHWDTMLNASVKADKTLLLVEGDDDKSLVEQLLEAVDPLWSKAAYVGVAGDRGKVLAKLELAAGSLQAIVDPQLAGWTCYGAIWWELQRLRGRFAVALPSSDLGHPLKDACDPGKDEGALRARLNHYSELLRTCDVDAVVSAIQARKKSLDGMSDAARIKIGIHGKRFFDEVMGRALNRVIGQRKSDDWRPYVGGRWTTLWPDYLKRFAAQLLK